MGRERKEIVLIWRSKTYKILDYFTFVLFAGGGGVGGNKTHRNIDISKNIKKMEKDNISMICHVT